MGINCAKGWYIMTIKEANNKLEKIDNDIEYWLKEKEIELSNVLPKAVDIKKERVVGGKREDRFFKYAEALEHKKIDDKLDKLYAQKRNIEDYIEKELHRLGKYREVEQLIVYYKEQCLEEHTWVNISQKVYMSVSQCKKIYKKFKDKRNV